MSFVREIREVPIRDGSGGFPFYENGGVTACYACFTIQALKVLGRTKEADAILFPMLKAFEEGDFQGYGPWKEL